MKTLLSILATLLLLSGSIYYLNSYSSLDDELEAYEQKMDYDQETGELYWDLSSQALDDYQMQAIRKTLQRKQYQKYIESDYVTSLKINLSQATKLTSIQPLLEGISKGMDHRLQTLELQLFNCKIDVDESFQNWYLPQSITTFNIDLEKTSTTSLRNILLSIKGTLLRELSISKESVDTDFDWDASFSGIVLPFTLKSMNFKSQHNQKVKQPNFDNLAKSLQNATLDSLNIYLRAEYMQSIHTSMEILGRYQTQLKNLRISFRNNSSVYNTQKKEFTKALNSFIRSNKQLQLLNMDLSYVSLDKYYLSDLEDILYDRHSENWKVYLTIVNTHSSITENKEIFQDVQTEMGSKLNITYA